MQQKTHRGPEAGKRGEALYVGAQGLKPCRHHRMEKVRRQQHG